MLKYKWSNLVLHCHCLTLECVTMLNIWLLRGYFMCDGSDLPWNGLGLSQLENLWFCFCLFLLKRCKKLQIGDVYRHHGAVLLCIEMLQEMDLMNPSNKLKRVGSSHLIGFQGKKLLQRYSSALMFFLFKNIILMDLFRKI